MMYWIKVSQENYLQNSFRLIVVTPKELPTFLSWKKNMVDSVDSDHIPLTSPIPNLHMWRLHIFSSSNTNVGHFWKLNQLGKPPGGTRRGKKHGWTWNSSTLTRKPGEFLEFFFSRQRKSVLGVWKREGLTTKKTQKGGSVVVDFFQKKNHHPEIFRRSIFVGPIKYIQKNVRLLLFKRALLGVHKRSLIRFFPFRFDGVPPTCLMDCPVKCSVGIPIDINFMENSSGKRIHTARQRCFIWIVQCFFAVF